MEKLLTIGVVTSEETPFLLELLFNISNQCHNYNLLERCEVIITSNRAHKNENSDLIQRFSKQFTVLEIDDASNSKSVAKNKIIDACNSKYITFVNSNDNFTDLIDKLCYELLENQTKDVFLSEVQNIESEGAITNCDYPCTNELFGMSDEQFERDHYKVIFHQPECSQVYNVKFLKDNNLYYRSEEDTIEDIYRTQIALLSNVRYGRINTKYYGTHTKVRCGNVEEQLDLLEKIITIVSENYDNKLSSYLLYAVWNQAFSSIRKQLKSDGSNSDIRNYLKRLNIITRNHKKIIRKTVGNLKEYASFSYKVKFLSGYSRESFVLMYFQNKINELIKSRREILKKTTVVFTLLPLNNKKIFFSSQYGKYNDNSKYLYQTMKKDPKYAKFQFVFAVNDAELYKNNKDFINYGNKLSFYYHHYTAKKVYFNTWVDGDLKKRYKQTWIQLWHGYPYKKIYSDVETFDYNQGSNKQKSINNWDSVWSVDKKNTAIFKKLFPSVKIIEEEYPKTLWVINNKDNQSLKSDLIAKYGLSEEGKYVLYAPTYRPYYYDFNLDDIRDLIPNGYQLIVHLHPYVKAKLLNKIDSDIILTKVPDIQEVVLIVDRLITDYSSLAYDYIAIGKSVEYFCPDIELYKKVHGLYEETTLLSDKVFNKEFDANHTS